MLRSLLGMPEKETLVEVIPEEPVEVKPAVKGGKEERKAFQKEEKKTAGAKEKEEKKGAGKTLVKEERPNSRKAKGKETKKAKSFIQETKDMVIQLESAEAMHPDPRHEQVDPIVQGKYHEKLYVEVYGLLNAMVSNMAFLFEELKEDALEEEA
uniref:Uncharacterized protein n=1 Tax=Sphenodon punctatus TaxID=8508 RepID=A0A8D0GX62_SPHPU